MKVRRDMKGFTLIELLIVIAIIGILAAIAIPAYTSYTGKAKVAGVVHSMGAIKNAVAAYHVEAGGTTVPVAANAAAIQSTYGIEVATQYALFDVAATGAITATLQNVNSDVDTLLIVITPDASFKTWDWNSSTVPVAYRPKG